MWIWGIQVFFFIESKSKFEQLCSLCCKIKSETAVNVVSPQAMFSTDLIESKQERVAINGVEPQMIGMLVSYAYTSEVYISKANVQVKLPNNPPVPLTPSFPLVFPSLFFQSWTQSLCCRLSWQRPTCWTWWLSERPAVASWRGRWMRWTVWGFTASLRPTLVRCWRNAAWTTSWSTSAVFISRWEEHADMY